MDRNEPQILHNTLLINTPEAIMGNHLATDLFENLPVAVYTCDTSGYISNRITKLRLNFGEGNR